jgi:mRNA-degrading endonuclease RelE of RelBE toxin-antitoxin system
MNIIWSNEAKEIYLEIIDDLLIRWPDNIAYDFVDRVDELLNLLKTNKHLCPASGRHKKIHKCVVHSNISLIYKINNNTIEIITLIHNKTNHIYYYQNIK